MDLPQDSELIRSLEMIEVDAMVDLHRAMPGELWEQLGAGVESIGTAGAIVLKQLPIMLFNRVIGLGIEAPATKKMVDEIYAIYEKAGVRACVQLAPTAQPEAVSEWLEERGMTPRDTWAKLYRDAQPIGPVETSLTIEQIGEDRAEEFGAIAMAAFGLPEPIDSWIASSTGREGWHHYMALEGGKGVAVAGLYIKRDVSWFGIAGTLASSRGKGAQSALIARRIQDAIEAGCRWMVVEADPDTPDRPNPSYRNLVKMGFKLAYERPNYRA
jgi:hypothetical protein